MKAIPEVGDKIYVPSAYYIDRDHDDFEGGLATINRVITLHRKRDVEVRVTLKERPMISYSWTYNLGPKQSELEKEYKDRVAHIAPDSTRESHRGW